MKVAFLGNGFIDRIHIAEDDISFSRAGGAANCHRAFISLAGKTAGVLKIDEDHTTLAKIKVKRDGFTKSVKANLVLGTVPPVSEFFDWIHLSYLNTVDLNPNVVAQLKSHTRCLSGDVCAGGQEKWKSHAHLFDYVFFSNDEHSHCKAAAEIVHSRDKLVFRRGQERIDVVLHKPYNDVIILGAGDYLAAAFIYQKLKTGDDEQACYFAIEQTPHLIKKLNEFKTNITGSNRGSGAKIR